MDLFPKGVEMATVEPTQYARVLDEIRHWPVETRRELLRDVTTTLAEETRPLVPRGFSAAQVAELLRTDRPAPTDEECEQILEEELMKKYSP